MPEISTENNEPSKIDTAASDACTRAGTLALALSLVLFLLVQPWAHRPSEDALKRYVTARLYLSMMVDRIDEDPAWDKLRNSTTDLESLPLNKLPNALNVVSGSSPTANLLPQTEKSRVSAKSRPAPPTALSVTVEIKIPEITAILETINQLNDSSLLTESRNYSNYYGLSIVHWAQKRSDLVYRNVLASNCAKSEIEAPQGRRVPENFVASINPDVLMDCLTFNDVRALSQFERPIIAGAPLEQIERDVDISPGTLPRNLFPATLVADVLLFFTLMYFGAFAREAECGGTLHTRGTLFSALSNSRATLALLSVLIWMPFVASLTVAVVSLNPYLWVASGVILLTVISIFSIFKRSGYFDPIWPRNWQRRRQEI